MCKWQVVAGGGVNCQPKTVQTSPVGHTNAVSSIIFPLHSRGSESRTNLWQVAAGRCVAGSGMYKAGIMRVMYVQRRRYKAHVQAVAELSREERSPENQ